CRNKFGAAEIGYGCLPEAKIRRLLGENLHALQIPTSIDIERQLSNSSQLHRSPCVRITYAGIFWDVTNIWLWIDEIVFLFQFFQLLIGENAQSRFAIHNCARHSAVEYSDDWLVSVTR